MSGESQNTEGQGKSNKPDGEVVALANAPEKSLNSAILFEDEGTVNPDLYGDDPVPDFLKTSEASSGKDADQTAKDGKEEVKAEKAEGDADKSTDNQKAETGTDAQTKKGQEAESKKEEEKDEQKADEGKPPKGFVSQKALAETRAKLKTANQRISKMESQIAELQKQGVKPQKDDGEDFDKELTEDELEDLVEDDPSRALRYLIKQRKAESPPKKESADTDDAQDTESVNLAYEMMEAEVPGLFDKAKPETRKSLSEFAAKMGLDGDYPAIFTDPNTMIMGSGHEKPVILGEGAVSVLRFVKNAYDAVQTANREKDALAVKLEKEIREKVEKELVAKFIKTGGKDFKSIADLPGSEEEPEDSRREFTEDEWARLPAEKRKELLGI